MNETDGETGNIKRWIEEFMERCGLSWDDVEAIHIGGIGWTNQQTVVLPIEEAKRILDYDFVVSYGSPSAHKFLVYFKDWVLFKKEYDGLENLEYIPRDPNPKFVPKAIGD